MTEKGMARSGSTETGPMNQTETLSPIWSGATVYDGGWIYSDWYGYLFPQQDWILHLEHDWQYCIGNNSDNVFFYDFGVGVWAYTNSSLYPWMYWYGNLNGWSYYYRDGRVGNRWFYLPATSEYRNDNTLNGAVFTEISPREIPVVSSSGPTRVSDPKSTILFEVPNGQSGTIRVASLDEAPPTPFPGTGLAIDVSGVKELSLIVPASDLPGDSFPVVYVYAEMQGAFDDEIGYAERWIGLPYTELLDGSYSFELPLTEPDAPGTGSPDGYWQLKSSKKGARHFAVAKVSAATILPSLRLQTADYLKDFIAALKPSRALAVTNLSDDAPLSFTFGAAAYTGFNKLRAWSWGRTFQPVLQLKSPLKTGALAHETGHYLTHLLVGHSTYDALENAGGSLFSGNHGIRDSIGRYNLLEDYAYFIEFFLSSYGGNYNLERPDITFQSMHPTIVDFPGVEGFAATMLACLHISTDIFSEQGGGAEPIPPLGLGYPDIFEIMAKGATSVDALRANIASSLSSDRQEALQVLLQRIGWNYWVEGVLVDDKGNPVVGATVASITKVGDTIYEGEVSFIPSKADGSFRLSGDVFGGDSFIQVTKGGGEPIEVPISIDWAELTTNIIDLGELVVAANEDSDVSFNLSHAFIGWPDDFSLNLSANFNVEVQGIDNASYRIEQSNKLTSHEPEITISVYAPIGSNVTVTGNASITPGSLTGTYQNSPWNLAEARYSASNDFSNPTGSPTELNFTTPVGSGFSSARVYTFQASLRSDTLGRLSGVKGQIYIFVYGE